MIRMKRPNTADFNNSVFVNDKDIDDFNKEDEMDTAIMSERSKLGKSVISHFLTFLRV